MATAFTVGVGFTCISNVVGVPVHPFADGVTVTVDVMAVVPVFVAVKEAMLPIPVPLSPVAVLLLAQSKVVPLTPPVNVTAVVAAPLQTVWLDTVFTVGVGFTVTVNELGVPVQLLATGVTVIVDVIGALVLLVAVNGAIFPLPLAAKPIAEFEFAQLNCVPVTGPVKFTAVVSAPLQAV